MAQLQRGLKPFRAIPRDIVEWTTWMREQDSVLREYGSSASSSTSSSTVTTVAGSDGCLYEIKDFDSDYSLIGSDAGKILRSTSASQVTVTFNSGVFQVGEQITVYQAGAGQVTIAAGSGVTINTPATLTIYDQYASVSLVLVENDEWFIAGRMTPDGIIKASFIDSESATDGHVLTADGAGAAAWEVAPVTVSGTPANDQVAVWTAAGTIEGGTELTYAGGLLRIEVGSAKIYLDDTASTANNRTCSFGAFSDQLAFSALNDAEDTATQFFNVQRTGTTVDSITLTSTDVAVDAALKIKESAAAAADTAAYGQLWVKDNTPNNLQFTNDAGTDHAVATSSGTTGGSGSAGAGNQYVEININGTTYKVLHDGTV